MYSYLDPADWDEPLPSLPPVESPASVLNARMMMRDRAGLRSPLCDLELRMMTRKLHKELPHLQAAFAEVQALLARNQASACLQTLAPIDGAGRRGFQMTWTMEAPK